MDDRHRFEKQNQRAVKMSNGRNGFVIKDVRKSGWVNQSERSKKRYFVELDDFRNKQVKKKEKKKSSCGNSSGGSDTRCRIH